MSDPSFLPLDVVAGRLDVPVALVREMADAGMIPFLRVYGGRRFNLESVRVALMRRADREAEATSRTVEGRASQARQGLGDRCIITKVAPTSRHGKGEGAR